MFFSQQKTCQLAYNLGYYREKPRDDLIGEGISTIPVGIVEEMPPPHLAAGCCACRAILDLAVKESGQLSFSLYIAVQEIDSSVTQESCYLGDYKKGKACETYKHKRGVSLVQASQLCISNQLFQSLAV